MIKSVNCQLPHGYTLADLHDIARHAVATDWSHHAADYLDRYDIARSATAEVLYAADAPPDRRDLLHAARAALNADVLADLRHRGVSHHTYDTALNAVRYWTLSQVVHSHEDQVVDRRALAQIWPCLPDADREALAALAACDTYQAAAAALGLRYNTFHRRVRLARLRFLRLWHDGETPSGLWGHDRRAAPGGERAVAPALAGRMTGRRRAAARRAIADVVGAGKTGGAA